MRKLALLVLLLALLACPARGLEPEDAIGLLQTNTILSALQNSTK